jgi:hypothetical protein
MTENKELSNKDKCIHLPGFIRYWRNNGEGKGECVTGIDERQPKKIFKKKNNKRNVESEYINKINSIQVLKGNAANNKPAINNLQLIQNNIKINSANIYTQECDFKKFFQFLNTYKQLNKNIYVISHSHTMQDFIKESNTSPSIKGRYYGTTKKDYEKIFDQNIWSIEFKGNNNTFRITRHAFSIANTAKEKRKLYYTPDLRWIKRVRNQISEKDSALSIYGILSALNKNFEGDINIDTIYVSPLIRTWMTGVCLYLKECKEDKFKIVISPYIIEEGTTDDNIPNDFSIQCNVFVNFLNILKKINDIKFIIPSYEKKVIIVFDGRTNKSCEFKFESSSNLWSISDMTDVSLEIFLEINQPNIELPNTELHYTKLPNISFEKLIPGVMKPNKDAIKKLSRWCEPLAMARNDETFIKNKKCIERLNTK